MQNRNLPKPPSAHAENHVHENFGTRRVDPFYWMRQREDPRVLEHLKNENKHTDKFMESMDADKKAIVQRLRSRIKEEDQSVPYEWKEYSYFYRWQKNLEHPVYYRRSLQTDQEELVLDLNSLASAEGFVELGSFEVSPDGNWLIFTVDREGDEVYDLFFKELGNSDQAVFVCGNTSGDCTWLANSQHMAYVVLDEQTRPYEVQIRNRTEHQATSPAVYTESDPAFFVSVDCTRSGSFLVITTASNDTSEEWLMDARDVNCTPTVVIPRQTGVEYDIDHQGDHFFLTTNADGAKDFKILRSSKQGWKQSTYHWEMFLDNEPGRLVESVACFDSFIAVQVRVKLRQDILFFDAKGHQFRNLRFPLDAYELHEDINVDYKSQTLRLDYSSPKEPRMVFEYNPFTDAKQTLKQVTVPHFDSSDFESRTLWATGKDNTLIPIVVTGKLSTWKNQTGSPCYLTGYGAYGVSLSCDFSRDHLTLMDLGYLVASAHVRGGSELGRDWYEAGKLEHKENTFDDFISCAEHLIETGLTTSDLLVASGGSAGGMLMGVIVNRRPELWRSVAALVPFVDVLNTMLDETLLLTPMEYPEWGDPRDQEVFQRIQKYSPYDNIKNQPYPALYVTAGLNDPRVTYWEPTKWVAKLRQANSGSNPILLRVHMEAGHQGATGRYSYLQELAEEWVFHCQELGLNIREQLGEPIGPSESS